MIELVSDMQAPQLRETNLLECEDRSWFEVPAVFVYPQDEYRCSGQSWYRCGSHASNRSGADVILGGRGGSGPA
jgi:hypothetical protein